MWAFRAMSTAITVYVPGLAEPVERAIAAEIATLFTSVEQQFSAFPLASKNVG